jgi:hypothetical protein
VKLGRVVAEYHEQLLDDGGWAVAVNLTQEVPDGTGVDHKQALWCDLKQLNEIVEKGLVHEPTFEYQPGSLAAMKPAMREKVDPFEVGYFARERPDGKRHVAVVVEQKAEQDGQGPQQRFVCELNLLKEFAGEGKEFERILQGASRGFPIINVEPPNLRESDGRWAKAPVRQWAPSLEEGEKIVRENANTPGSSRLAVYPVAQRIGSKPHGEIEISHGVDGEDGVISRAISESCFDRYRDGANYVVALWDDLKRKPEVGMHCTYDGRKTSLANGEMRDYGAHASPKPGNEGLPEEKLYVLLKKDHASRLPFAATVEIASPNRGEVDAAFCRGEGLDPPRHPGGPKLGPSRGPGGPKLDPSRPGQSPSHTPSPGIDDLSQSRMPGGHRPR